MNKNAMTLSIPLLVIFTLLIVGASLFVFITQKGSIDKTINNAGFIEQIYERKILLDSYVQDIVSRASVGVNNEQEFIENAKKIISQDKIPVDLFIINKDNFIYFPEYPQIISQLKQENVQIITKDENKIINFSITFSIKDQFDGKETPYMLGLNKENKNVFSAVYTYKKSFEGVI
jgi:hypothetical protein